MQLIFADKDPYDPSTYEAVETNDILAALYARFNGRWPATARLYENEVSEANDITPQNHIDIERLASCRGRVYCIVYPGDFVSLVIAIVAVAASAAVAFLFQPKIPTVQGSVDRGGSSNNELSERQNKSNINGRIPDIFGQVRSTPDLIAQPYKIFVGPSEADNLELEYALMCIGRGEYAISDVKDDTTTVGVIDGSSVGIYGPNKVVGSSPADLTYGNYIEEPFLYTKRYTAINGQVLYDINKPQPPFIGPVVIDDEQCDRILFNLTSSSGFFQQHKTLGSFFAITLNFSIRVRQLDSFDNEFGPEYVVPFTFRSIFNRYGNQTYTYQLPFVGKCRFSLQVTQYGDAGDDNFGEFQGTVNFRDLYSARVLTESTFGSVTTVVAKTYATTGALAVKSRKLNLLATRKVPTWQGGASFSAPVPSTRAADIFVAVARDPYIGRRSVAELDLSSIYGTESEINSYFGTSEASAFCYTFDNSNVSFEETLTTIADSIFSTAYRRGNVIKLSFERETPNSVLLFNHRNKLPGTETRTIRFGNQNEYDGVKVTWVDPVDDAIATITLPMGGNPINSNNIESVGIRNYRQAWFFAHRAWNKIRYQNTLVEFEATQEADLLVIRDRILVADNTRAEVIDGQVEDAEGLTLTLSRPVSYEAGMSILLQHWDGSVENIPLVGSDGYNVTLQRAPKQSLSVDEEAYAKATFAIVSSAMDRTVGPFLLTERNPSSAFNSQVVAINYDSRYYQNDKDWINGVI